MTEFIQITSRMTPCVLVVIFLLTGNVMELRAMPSEYLDEATELASPEELNLLYLSIPHRRGVDKFKIHSSYRKNDTTKYFILSRPHRHAPQKTMYLLASTSPQGCFIHSESEKIPFDKGMVPDMNLTMPLEDMFMLYKSSLAVEFGENKTLQSVLPLETQLLIEQVVDGEETVTP